MVDDGWVGSCSQEGLWLKVQEKARVVNRMVNADVECCRMDGWMLDRWVAKKKISQNPKKRPPYTLYKLLPSLVQPWQHVDFQYIIIAAVLNSFQGLWLKMSHTTLGCALSNR